jgi:hypothetical protein
MTLRATPTQLTTSERYPRRVVPASTDPAGASGPGAYLRVQRVGCLSLPGPTWLTPTTSPAGLMP